MKTQERHKKNQLLNELNIVSSSCTKCNYCINSKKVYGKGNLDADICVIGEGPEEAEAESGLPFSGEAGAMLMRILSAVNIKEEEVYFTTSLLCRTSEKNRTPSQSEIENCRGRLFNEVSIVQPKVILLAGVTALHTILGPHKKLNDVHGTWITTLSPPCFFYFPIYHPSWILHSSTDGEKKARKSIMWKDIKEFADKLDIFKSIKN